MEKQTYKPQFALLSYLNQNGNYYLESRLINESKNGYCLGTGIPASDEMLRDFSRYFGAKFSESIHPMEYEGIIPDDILFTQQIEDKHILIFKIEPASRDILFKKNSKNLSYRVSLPKLIFKVESTLTSTNIWVYAVKDKKLSNSTKLYRGPFMNLYGNSSLCTGNMKIEYKNYTWDEMMRSTINEFFYTYFTHINDNQPINGDIYRLLEDLNKTKKDFPLNVLIPLNTTLENILS